MNQEQHDAEIERQIDEQREDGMVFIGGYLSNCCGMVMDYDQGRCPWCGEGCVPEAEVDGLGRTPEELLVVLNKARAEMREKGI